MRDITKEMINVYKIKELGYDFMGYTFQNLNELSFHHLIIPRKDSQKYGIKTGYVWWNGAILNQNTSHDYLHCIERIDRELFLKITQLIFFENQNLRLDKETLLQIRQFLLYFENKYYNYVDTSGEMLIKRRYIENRIIL